MKGIGIKGIGILPPTMGAVMPRLWDWFIDSVNGNDANTGKAPGDALQTISALMGKTIVAGETIGMARGSLWYEQLTLALDNIKLFAYGTGSAPIVDGTASVANGDFALLGGTVFVYQAAVVVDVGATAAFVHIYEDGVRLRYVTSTANCDATSGSYYMTGSSGAITIYVHASDDSDVTTNGKAYRYTTRAACVAGSNQNGWVVDGIQCQRALGGNAMEVRQATISNSAFVDGGSHLLRVWGGSFIRNCTFTGIHHTASATMLVVNADTPAGENTTVENCTFTQIYSYSNTGSGFNAHRNVGGQFGTTTLLNCSFVDFPISSISTINHTLVINITNCTWTNCKFGLGDPSAIPGGGCVQTVSGGTWTSNVASQRFYSPSYALATCVITGVTINCNATTDTGYIYISCAAVLTVTLCVFNSNLAAGNRICVYCTNPGADLTLTYNDYNGPQGWTYYYGFTAPAAGMTWASDFNSFAPTTTWSIFGVAYATLALYKAGTGQDANST